MTHKVIHFVKGMGSAIDMFSSLNTHSFGHRILDRSDTDCLRSDWEKVGNDLTHAFHQIEQDLTPHGQSK